MLTHLKTWFNSFEAWVNTWMPGFKTIVVTCLGAIGSTAALLQTYITQLPLEKFASATQIAIGTLVVSLLALWFHGLGDRVDTREQASASSTDTATVDQP